VEFPLSFDLKKKSAELPVEWQDVADKRIGAIMIEIKTERHRMEPEHF
jgi:hypothetical protein